MSGIMCALAGSSGFGGAVVVPDSFPTSFQTGSTATATFSLLTTGTYTSTGEAGGTFCTPTSLTSGLDARLTLDSGSSLSGSATGTWLSLGTTRSWSLVSSLAGALISSATLEIRENASGMVLDTAAIEFSATSEP